MIRIHSGILKGKVIKRVDLNSTRETSSLVRQSVFNMLGEVKGNVLDLFAGSGTYGFTSYSLGAKKVFFVDNNKKAYFNLIENSKKLEIIDNVQIYFLDYKNFLKKNNERFDLIFLDPPYDFETYNELLESCQKILNNCGKIILENKNNNPIFENNNLSIIKEKKYGIKKIVIYQKNK